MILTSCFACATGVYDECANLQPIEGDPDHFMPCYNQAVAPAQAEVERRPVGRPVLDNSEVTNVLSTGRKRAALLYPVHNGMECSWAWLKYAGGGVKTIVGCAGNILYEKRGQYARHHGPDKNVLNNSPGNVHLICEVCHNRFHTLNDPYYGTRPEAGQPFIPIGYEMMEHDPSTLATDEEREENEAWWALNPAKRELIE